jgi:hypothetical protein
MQSEQGELSTTQEGHIQYMSCVGIFVEILCALATKMELTEMVDIFICLTVVTISHSTV